MEHTFCTHCEKPMGDSPGFIFVSHIYARSHTNLAYSLVRSFARFFASCAFFLFNSITISLPLSLYLVSFRLILMCGWLCISIVYKARE